MAFGCLGCFGSRAEPSSKKGPPSTSTAGANTKKASAPKKDLNPADYIVSKRKDEVIIKEQGSIDGEQFNIEECTNCDIFLLDHIATTFIDYCENCRIYVGPVESSVMIRNSNKCDMIIACQQFRSRDCANCRFALFCCTEPIIETSQDMQFACFDFSYFSLRDQIARAGLKLWNNKWWQIYDFNKNPDNPNWSIFPQDQVPQLLRLDKCTSITDDELAMDRVVPITLGSRAWPYADSCFIIFLPDSDAYVEALFAKAAKTDSLKVCRTKSIVLGDERVKSLLSWAKEPKTMALCKNKEITGVEVCGEDITKHVEDAFSNNELASPAKHMRIVPEKESATLGKAFFEVWKDEI